MRPSHRRARRRPQQSRITRRRGKARHPPRFDAIVDERCRKSGDANAIDLRLTRAHYYRWCILQGLLLADGTVIKRHGRWRTLRVEGQIVYIHLYDFRRIQAHIVTHELWCIAQKFNIQPYFIRLGSGQLKAKLPRASWTNYPASARKYKFANCVEQFKSFETVRYHTSYPQNRSWSLLCRTSAHRGAHWLDIDARPLGVKWDSVSVYAAHCERIGNPALPRYPSAEEQNRCYSESLPSPRKSCANLCRTLNRKEPIKSKSKSNLSFLWLSRGSSTTNRETHAHFVDQGSLTPSYALLW